jgi:hypothetical protein
MEQIYAVRALLHGESRLFVSRAIRGVGHCDFNLTELQNGFADHQAGVTRTIPVVELTRS